MKEEFQNTQEAQTSALPSPLETTKEAGEELLAQETPQMLNLKERLHKHAKAYKRGWVSYVVTIALFIITTQIFPRSLLITPLCQGFWMVLWSWVIFNIFRLQRERKQIRKEIEEANTQHDLGTAIQTLMVCSSGNMPKTIREEAREDATMLLAPQQNQWQSITPHQRRYLRQILEKDIDSLLFRDVTDLFSPKTLKVPNIRREVEFRAAVMRAFTLMGTAEELPALERLAKLEPKSDVEEALKQSAIEYLPLLQARVATLSDQNTLLRASHPTEENSLLLRPSQESQEPTEQLLRPH